MKVYIFTDKKVTGRSCSSHPLLWSLCVEIYYKDTNTNRSHVLFNDRVKSLDSLNDKYI